MSLEDRIRAILQESSEAKPEDEKIEETTSDEKLDEEGVPGIGKDLSGVGKETSAAEDNAKIEKGKAKKDGETGKLPEVSGGSSDAKASEETSKIKEKYKSKGMEKLTVKEDMVALFDGEELTEAFKQKAEAIFEAAVEHRANEKVQQLQEEYQSNLTEAIDEVKGELVEQIDEYLDHVVEQWMEDNAVALESGIKVEMVSSFMSGMKKLFEDHYIDVPEDKLDIVAEQAKKLETIEAELSTLREEKDLAESKAQMLQCEAEVAKLSEGLTSMETDKFKSLVENVEFDTDEEFASKAKTIRESYFKKGQVVEAEKSQDPTEAVIVTEAHDDVAAVLKAIKSGSLKIVRSSN